MRREATKRIDPILLRLGAITGASQAGIHHVQTASPRGRARATEGWPQNISAIKKASGNASDKPVVELNRRSWQVSLFLNDTPTGSVTAHKGSTAASRLPTEDNVNTSGLLQKMLADHEPLGSSCKLQGIRGSRSLSVTSSPSKEKHWLLLVQSPSVSPGPVVFKSCKGSFSGCNCPWCRVSAQTTQYL